MHPYIRRNKYVKKQHWCNLMSLQKEFTKRFWVYMCIVVQSYVKFVCG